MNSKRGIKRTCLYQKRSATLDTHHQDKLLDISNAKCELKKAYEDLEKHRKDTKRCEEIQSQIDKIKKRADEIEYFTNTADILFTYYNTIEKNNEGSLYVSSYQPPLDTSSSASASSSRMSVIDYFNKSEANNKKDTERESFEEEEDQITKDTKNTTQPVCRAHLLDIYLSYTDANYINNNVQQVSISVCPYCKNPDRQLFIGEGIVHCNVCSTIEHIITDNDKPSYKDPPKEISYFAYARINHFVEWLNNIQGKETTNIPDHIFDAILLELKKYRCTNLSEVSKKQVKDILKKLKLNKYYEHTPYIWQCITGQENPHFTPELEEKLKSMFKETQVPYLKYAPAKRKNFLSYAYTLNKLLGILGEEKLMKHFPLLKSREKLHQQEQIWKNICEELRWPFIRSI